MLLEIVGIINSALEVGIDLFIFYRLSQGVRRKWLVLANTVLGSLAMIGMEEIRFDQNIKFLFGLVLMGVLGYSVFRLQIRHAVKGVALMAVGTMVSELLATGLLMLVMGTDFFRQFTLKTEVQMQGAILSNLILFTFVFLVTNAMKQRDSRYSGREVLLILIQNSTFIFTMILTVELATQEGKYFRIPPVYFCFLGIGCMFVYFLSFYVTTGYFQSKKEKIELVKMEAEAKQQVQYYEYKLNAQQQVRQLYHDMKNHMLALRELHQNSGEEWNEYLKEMEQQLIPYQEDFCTGNKVVDALLYDKKIKTEREGILLETDIQGNCMKQMSSMLLCTILGNGLDNAMEAVRLLMHRKRKIWLCLSCDEHHLRIMIRNEYEGELRRKAGEILTKKADGENHGIGLKSIEKAVKNCHGNMSVTTRDHVFELFVLLPIKGENEKNNRS